MKLKNFIPQCQSGNILVTTRNRELRHLSAKDGDAKVGAMEHEDAKNLLLDRARAEESDENKVLAEAIVKVLPLILVSLKYIFSLKRETGPPLLCFGYFPSWRLHSLPVVIKRISRILSTSP